MGNQASNNITLYDQLRQGSNEFPQQLSNLVQSISTNMGVPNDMMSKVQDIIKDVSDNANQVNNVISNPGSIKRLHYCRNQEDKQPMPTPLEEYFQQIEDIILATGQANILSVVTILQDLDQVATRLSLQEDNKTKIYKLCLEYMYNDLHITVFYIYNTMQPQDNIELSIPVPGTPSNNITIYSDANDSLLHLQNTSTEDAEEN